MFTNFYKVNVRVTFYIFSNIAKRTFTALINLGLLVFVLKKIIKLKCIRYDTSDF